MNTATAQKVDVLTPEMIKEIYESVLGVPFDTLPKFYASNEKLTKFFNAGELYSPLTVASVQSKASMFADDWETCEQWNNYIKPSTKSCVQFLKAFGKERLLALNYNLENPNRDLGEGWLDEK